MNEVLIIVKSRNDTKPIFDEVRRDAHTLGRDAGRIITDETSAEITRRATATSGGYADAGDRIGETIGRRVSQRITQRITETINHVTNRFRNSTGGTTNGSRSGGIPGDNGADGRGRVTVDVDVDRGSLFSRFANLGKDLGARIAGGIGGVLTGVMSGDFVSMLLKGLTVGTLTYALAPILGAGVSSALLVGLGGGVLGAGIAAAFKDPQVQAAFRELKARASKEFAEFGEAFKPGVLRFFDRLKTDIAPQLKPMIQELKSLFGPLTEDIGDGLIGFLQNALPGITRAAKASEPLIKTLAESLPALGEDIGYFFDKIAESGPAANIFFNDLLSVLGWIIRRIGDMLNFFTHAYNGVRMFFVNISRTAMKAFDMILTGAEKALGWIPGLGPKLSGARKSFEDFRKNANKQLDLIENETVTVTIRQVFTTVGRAVVDLAGILGRASGGIIGGAASGGPRSGLTWVGEHGPELISAAPGSRVHSNPDSMRMARGPDGGGSPLLVQLLLDGRVLAEQLVDPMRQLSHRFGGDVQATWGR